MGIKINKLEMEWTDDGCVARAEGFTGVMITCPRCQALLPRDEEHRCGDRIAPPLGKRPMPKAVKGDALLRRRLAQKRRKR